MTVLTDFNICSWIVRAYKSSIPYLQAIWNIQLDQAGIIAFCSALFSLLIPLTLLLFNDKTSVVSSIDRTVIFSVINPKLFLLGMVALLISVISSGSRNLFPLVFLIIGFCCFTKVAFNSLQWLTQRPTDANGDSYRNQKRLDYLESVGFANKESYEVWQSVIGELKKGEFPVEKSAFVKIFNLCCKNELNRINSAEDSQKREISNSSVLKSILSLRLESALSDSSEAYNLYLRYIISVALEFEKDTDFTLIIFAAQRVFENLIVAAKDSATRQGKVPLLLELFSSCEELIGSSTKSSRMKKILERGLFSEYQSGEQASFFFLVMQSCWGSSEQKRAILQAAVDAHDYLCAECPAPGKIVPGTIGDYLITDYIGGVDRYQFSVLERFLCTRPQFQKGYTPEIKEKVVLSCFEQFKSAQSFVTRTHDISDYLPESHLSYTEDELDQNNDSLERLIRPTSGWNDSISEYLPVMEKCVDDIVKKLDAQPKNQKIPRTEWKYVHDLQSLVELLKSLFKQ